MRLGPLVGAAAAAGGGQQAGTSSGEGGPGLGQQEQHQYQAPRQQRDANARRKHCPLAGCHLSCTAASSHPISPAWSFLKLGGGKVGGRRNNTEDNPKKYLWTLE